MQGCVCCYTCLCGRGHLDYAASFFGTSYTAEKQDRHHLGCWAGTISVSILPKRLLYKHNAHTYITLMQVDHHQRVWRRHVAMTHIAQICSLLVQWSSTASVAVNVYLAVSISLMVSACMHTSLLDTSAC